MIDTSFAKILCAEIGRKAFVMKECDENGNIIYLVRFDDALYAVAVHESEKGKYLIGFKEVLLKDLMKV